MGNNLTAFVNGIPIFFIGMIVVFSMLVLLILFMTVFGLVMGNATKNKKAKQDASKEVVKAEEEVAATQEAAMQDDLELVAVITAAIAASLGTTSDRLQVRSLRKMPRKAL